MKLAIMIPILAATVLLGQTPQRPAAGQGAQAGKGKEALTTVLGLSDSQIEQLTALRKEERQALQPARQEMQQAQKALRDAMAAGTSDPAAIGKLTMQLRDLRQQALQANQTYRDRALGLLTEEQKTKVQNLQTAMQRLQRMRPAIAAATQLNLLEPPRAAAGGAKGAAAAGAGAKVRARAVRRAAAGRAAQ
jgi:Spy/CpxP family protein refolding chaperone